MEDTKKQARKNKSVNTLLQRRRLLPNINSSEAKERARSERQATNSVIQGTAADVVKIAMIKTEEFLCSDPKAQKSRLLLNIHE